MKLLVKSKVRRKIIYLFSLNPLDELYPAQVAHEIGESPYVVGMELKALAKGGLLKKREAGGMFYYQWREDHLLAPELKLIAKKMLDQRDSEVLEIPDLTRRREIQRNLDQVLGGLKKYYDPEKVILFGSAATGRVGPHSDIDLIVIKETALNYFDRVEQLVDLLDYDLDVDFLVYTPEEFQKAVKERPFFRDEIMKKGKVLYEKAARRMV